MRPAQPQEVRSGSLQASLTRPGAGWKTQPRAEGHGLAHTAPHHSLQRGLSTALPHALLADGAAAQAPFTPLRAVQPCVFTWA